MFQNRIALPAAVTAVAIALLVSGCAAAPPTPDGTAATSSFKACAVSGSGGWNDHSFNQQVYEGLQLAKKGGVQIAALESRTSDDFAPGLSTLVGQGCKLVFSVGFDANDAVNAAAEANPKVEFVTVDGFAKDPAKTPNLKPITYRMAESSYLGGYLAAAHSTSHVIGTFGAISNPAITDFMNGYYAGAKAWAHETGTPTTVLGWNPTSKSGSFVGGFTNQVAAKTIATAQLNQGADVLFPVAGPLFAGAAQAIKESGGKAVFLGVDSDIAVTNPEYKSLILTSVEKRMIKAVDTVIVNARKGDFDAKPYEGTLANDGTGLAPFHDFADHVPSTLRDALAALTKRISSGDIDPTTP